jgi:Dual-action HEIGH metallo-peptidase
MVAGTNIGGESLMKRARVSIVALFAVVALAFSLAGPVGAGAQSPSSGKQGAVPTFKQFEKSTYRDGTGQYIVNGDEPIATRAALRDYYNRMVTSSNSSDPLGLIVNRVGGSDDKWSASQALNLTYCVSTRFGSSQAGVIDAMATGVALWENATTKVNFTYVPSENSRCRTSNNRVLFSVEPTNSTQFIARAFFPSTGDPSRNVLVNANSLFTAGVPAGNVMGHELGHTLGFRHEHTRPESGTCFEDNNWRPLTPYDSASIMHYPQCNGTSSDLSFTSSDGDGVRALYGS